MTAAGIGVAIGAAVVAIGLVEVGTDSRHPSPLDNGWVQTGGILMLVGGILAISVLFVLVVSRIRHERTRSRIVARHVLGTDYLHRLDETKPMSADEARAINDWAEETQDLLLQTDPMVGYVSRFLNPSGLPLPQQPFTVEPHKTYQRALSNHTARLAEFIAELER